MNSPTKYFLNEQVSKLRPVHILAISDTYHVDDQLAVTNLIDDPIIALPDSIEFAGRQLSRDRRSRFVGEFPNAADDSLPVLLSTDRCEFLCRGRLDQNSIFSHCA